MKIMICGGGTAGHVYPGLALAEALKTIDDRADIVFVGSDGGLETGVVPQAGYPLETLPVKGLPRRLSKESLMFGVNLISSLLKASVLLNQYQPAVVVGMGGFAGFPMVWLAARQGYPTVIHEQNSIPGLANRRLSRRVDLVALSFEDRLNRVAGAKAVKVVGNPVRQEVLKATRREGMRALGLDERQVTVLVFGGSRGARKINNSIISAYDLYRHIHNLQIVHITGAGDFEEMKARLAAEQQGHDRVAYHIFPYIKEMGPVYAAADLVVARAGAGTLAEITARGLPAIVIPYPYATDNHQVENAVQLEAAGAVKVIMDENLNQQILWQALSSFVYHAATLREASVRSARFGRPEAAAELARLVMQAAERTPRAQPKSGPGDENR